jgi:hypothetical protein
MAAGAVFPPVVVFFNEEEYWLADSFHRIIAANAVGLAEIEPQCSTCDGSGNWQTSIISATSRRLWGGRLRAVQASGGSHGQPERSVDDLGIGHALCLQLLHHRGQGGVRVGLIHAAQDPPPLQGRHRFQCLPDGQRRGVGRGSLGPRQDNYKQVV